MRSAWRKIDPRVGKKPGDRTEQLGQPGVVGARKRVGELIEIDVGLGERAFVRRDVAHVGEHRLVKPRVARPWLEHPQEEIEAVHLGFDETVVAALRRAPAAGADGGEAAAELGQARRLGGHGAGGIVGPAGDDGRMVERAPVGEQLHEPGVTLFRRRGRLGDGSGHCAQGQCDEQDHADRQSEHRSSIP